MTFEEAAAKQQRLEAQERAASERLKAYPHGAMGLVTEEIRLSPEYQADRAAWESIFAAYRSYNAWYVKAFKQQLREQRRQRDAQRQAEREPEA